MIFYDKAGAVVFGSPGRRKATVGHGTKRQLFFVGLNLELRRIAATKKNPKR
jgi:hypothetical protein